MIDDDLRLVLAELRSLRAEVAELRAELMQRDGEWLETRAMAEKLGIAPKDLHNWARGRDALACFVRPRGKHLEWLAPMVERLRRNETH